MREEEYINIKKKIDNDGWDNRTGNVYLFFLNKSVIMILFLKKISTAFRMVRRKYIILLDFF